MAGSFKKGKNASEYVSELISKIIEAGKLCTTDAMILDREVIGMKSEGYYPPAGYSYKTGALSALVFLGYVDEIRRTPFGRPTYMVSKSQLSRLKKNFKVGV